MSEFIPTCTWTDLVKIVKEGKIEELKACEITFNSKLIFIAMIPHGDYIAKDYTKINAEVLGAKANSNGGVDPEELLKEKVDATV